MAASTRMGQWAQDAWDPVRDSIVRVGTGIVSAFHYFYLSRVPLSGLALFLALPVLAQTGLKSLLLGAYDMGGFWESVLIAVVFWALAGATFIAARIIWQQAPVRFGLQTTPYREFLDLTWCAALVGAVVLNCVTVLRASDPGLFTVIAAGLVSGSIVSGGGYLVAQDWEEEMSNTGLRRWLVARFQGLGFDRQPGYFLAGRAEGASELAPGHAAALSYGSLLLPLWIALVYKIIPIPLPALAALLLLAAVVIFYLAATAFFLDFYRVPILLLLVAYGALMVTWETNDHFYRIWRSHTVQPPTPADVVIESEKAGRPLVVVAAAGGGIQSAAWTTAVLQQLHEELRPAGVDFAGSVRLISGVSGGSVGGLFFAHAFGSHSTNRFDLALRSAESSALDRAMEGMLRFDIRRAVLPFSFMQVPVVGMGLFDDRGDTLEAAWAANALRHLTDAPSLADATLAGWAADALALKRPALVFNSTLVETGERLALSTVPVSKSSIGKTEFFHRYKADVAMTTAARLSATFPIISPPARPAVATGPQGNARPRAGFTNAPIFPRGGQFLHAVDGGYYENSGLVGAIEWLNDAFVNMQARHVALPREVLLLELNPFPARPWVDETQEPDLTAAPLDAQLSSKGMGFDLTAPLNTIANVRNSGQRAFARQVLCLFTNRWELATASGVRIHHVPIYYPRVTEDLEKQELRFPISADPRKPPLSWHLRLVEQQDIRRRIQIAASGDTFQVISNFFTRHPR